jgi:hypothetical protein
MTQKFTPKARLRAASEIKLLRLELLPRGLSPSEQIGFEWSPAQPTESLSPAAAAQSLGLEEFDVPSVVKKRYRTLQMRYPPEQFSTKHLDWRPSSELLSHARARLNWFWQSGLVPEAYSDRSPEESPLWNRKSCEGPLTPDTVLLRWAEQRNL